MNLQLLSLQSLFVSLGLVNLATAALGTLVALKIAQNGGSQEAASLVAASYSLGFLIGCFFISRPLARVGHIRAFAAGAAICTISTLLLSIADSTVATLLARFATGLATAGIFAVGDAWINDTAQASSRGRILALYSIVIGIAAFLSQFFVVLTSGNFDRSFLIVSMLYCLAIVMLVSTRSSPPEPKSGAGVRLKSAYQTSPTAFVGAFVGGFVVTVLLNILPFRASQIGVNSLAIALAISAIYAGRIIIQYPLGIVSDRTDRRIVIVLVALACTVVLFLLTSLSSRDGAVIEGRHGVPALLGMVGALVLLGGGMLSLYSLLVSHAMDRTEPDSISSTAVTLLFVYTIGGVIGPVVSAIVSESFGDAAISWMNFFVVMAFCGFSVLRIMMRRAATPRERFMHTQVPPTSIEMLPTDKER